MNAACTVATAVSSSSAALAAGLLVALQHLQRAYSSQLSKRVAGDTPYLGCLLALLLLLAPHLAGTAPPCVLRAAGAGGGSASLHTTRSSCESPLL
jgi:hypothetical protein